METISTAQGFEVGVLLLTSALLHRWRFLLDIALVAKVGHYDRYRWFSWLLSDLYVYEEARYRGFGVGDRRGVVLSLMEEEDNAQLAV